LTPWRRRGPRSFTLPLRRTHSVWSEQWHGTEDRVRAVAGALRADGSVIRSGGDWDRWDLEVRGGLLGVARIRIGIEEHGAGRQLVRVRSWPYAPRAGLLLGALASTLAIIGLILDKDAAASVLGVTSLALVLRLLYECGAACATVAHALRRPVGRAAEVPEASEGTAPEPLALGVELSGAGSSR
jgi:hypothetical protein